MGVPTAPPSTVPSTTELRPRSRRRLPGWLLVPLGLAVVAGCSPAHLYSADAGFSRQTTITVQSTLNPNVNTAIQWWNGLAGRQVFALTNDQAQIAIVADDGSCASDGHVACAAGLSATGAYSDPPAYPYATCVVKATAQGGLYWQVFAHELGHCLGFEHVTDRASIMNPNPDAGNPAADQAMLRAAGYTAAK